jgi:hypothetical protein
MVMGVSYASLHFESIPIVPELFLKPFRKNEYHIFPYVPHDEATTYCSRACYSWHVKEFIEKLKNRWSTSVLVCYI